MKQSHGARQVIGRQILNLHLSEGRKNERHRIETRELRSFKIKLSCFKNYPNVYLDVSVMTRDNGKMRNEESSENLLTVEII